ncbi:MAG: aminoglycoside phosphotransferase family protein [Clostridiales bacterium]|nr:aminoglycoside phosphotransferase family protein [Clostridiales bacterium]
MNNENMRNLTDTISVEEKKVLEVIRILKEDDIFQITTINFEKMADGSIGDVYKIYGAGIGSDNNQSSFELVYKKVKRFQRYGDPMSWNRESMMYKSGVFNSLPDNFRVPKCYLIDEISNDEIVLWLELINGKNGDTFMKEDFNVPAYQLGLFHGSLRNIPQEVWLSSRHVPIVYATSWGTWSVDWLLCDEKAAYLSKEFKQSVLEVWSYIDLFMQTLAKLPFTLCHRDYNYENIFINEDDKGNEQVVVIDWDTTGIGVLGEDIADFTLEALVYKETLPIGNAQDIKEIQLIYYIKGLSDTGWQGVPDDIYLGYTITIALHWTFRCLDDLRKAKTEEAKKRFLEIIEFCVKEARIAKNMIDARN